MEELHTGYDLCCYSRSELFEGDKVYACPLGKRRHQAVRCPCKTRKVVEVLQSDREFVTVMVCLYPLDWRGERVQVAKGGDDGA
jgi:hypothetical protein